jgi:hypothetical protein
MTAARDDRSKDLRVDVTSRDDEGGVAAQLSIDEHSMLERSPRHATRAGSAPRFGAVGSFHERLCRPGDRVRSRESVLGA